MSSQNISRFGHHFKRLDMLNSNYITDVSQSLALEFRDINVRHYTVNSSVIQPPALFTSDQVSLS